MSDYLKEKCAVFGVYGKGLEAARLTYFGLYALQHRGQESSGISASDGKMIRTHKAMGLVPQVYQEEDLEKLKGHMAIGHNRYSTYGGSFFEHTQPFTDTFVDKKNFVALAHNGNLPNVKKITDFLNSKKIANDHLNDSGLMHATIAYFLKSGLDLEESIKQSFPLFTGAFCLLVMTKDKIAAVRDGFGIRPFSIGKLNGGYVFSSETCALNTINASYIRDVQPGEMVIVDKKGLRSYQLTKPNQKLDIFEFVYFSRPDSMLLGKSVYEVRKNLGKQLALEHPIKADVVIPVPDSAVPAAIGYATTLNIPFDFGLVKNRYIGRTFIMPDQRLRDRGVQMKLNPIEEILKGKKVVVIDDSIVRGTTTKKLIRMIRNAGAKKVHLMSSCPPVRYPDYYGIDTPIQKDLIAARMSIAKIKQFVNADSLSYLSYEGLIKATGLSENVFCTSCFSGEYPIDIGDHKKKIKFIPYKANGISKTKTPKKLAILISGGGTTMEATIKACIKGELKEFVAFVISSTKEAKGIQKAKALGIEPYILERGHYKSQKKFDKELLELLEKLEIDIISLQGWLPLISSDIITKYKGKIINQHPGPLDPGRPDFGGKGMTNPYRVNCARIAYAWMSGKDPWTESSTHFVTENFDQGDLIRIEKMKIPLKKKKVTIDYLRKNTKELIKTTHDLQKRFYPLEHKNVIKTLKIFQNGKVKTLKRTKHLIHPDTIPLLEEAKKLAIELFPYKNL